MKNSNKIKTAVKFAAHAILGSVFFFEGIANLFLNGNVLLCIGSTILGTILLEMARTTTYKKEGK